LAKRRADLVGGAEATELASALAEEASVIGGLPHVLAKEILQLGLTDAVDEGGGGADELALGFEEQAQPAGHFLHGGEAADGGG
jgi:hypothetical protein